MDANATVALGVFQDVSRLKDAAASLRDAGYWNTAASVLFPEKREATDFIEEKQTKPSDGSTTGWRIGAAVGGVFGWLTGSGVFDIPALGSLIISGRILGTLAGIGTGGLIGVILGALLHQEVARRVSRDEKHLTSCGFLLFVQCDNTDCAQKAEIILKNNGADAVSFNGSDAA